MSEWDDFEAEALAASAPRRGECTAGRLINSLPGEGAEALESALNREDLTTSAILRAIKRRADTGLSVYTLRRHRRGDCSCAGI